MTLKRLLALLLAVLMVFSLLSVLTACDSEDDDRSSSRRDDDDEDEDEESGTVDLDDLEWETTDEGIELTNYTGDETYVVLPDTIEGKKVVSIGNAFAGNVTVEVLVLGKYVEVLNFEDINECDSLVRLEGPGVKRTDGYFHVKNLEELILPELEELDVYDIHDAENLRYLDISNVQIINAMNRDLEEIREWPECLVEVVIPEGMLVRYALEWDEDHPYEPFGALAVDEVLDYDEDAEWDDLECGEAYYEIEDDPKAYAFVYCNFFQHDTIIVNGERYELD